MAQHSGTTTKQNKDTPSAGISEQDETIIEARLNGLISGWLHRHQMVLLVSIALGASILSLSLSAWPYLDKWLSAEQTAPWQADITALTEQNEAFALRLDELTAEIDKAMSEQTASQTELRTILKAEIAELTEQLSSQSSALEQHLSDVESRLSVTSELPSSGPQSAAQPSPSKTETVTEQSLSGREPADRPETDIAETGSVPPASSGGWSETLSQYFSQAVEGVSSVFSGLIDIRHAQPDPSSE